MNRIWISGCKNASNARSGTLFNPNLELHLEQWRPVTLLRKYHGILLDLCPPPQRERNNYTLIVTDICYSHSFPLQASGYQPHANFCSPPSRKWTVETLLLYLRNNIDEISEWQTDKLRITKVLLAYRTSLLESTGYSPYRVNFGWSPDLPVDIMLGRIPLPEEEEKKENPDFVEDVSHPLKEVYANVRQKLDWGPREEQDKVWQRSHWYQPHCWRQAWLYIPAVGNGKTKKLSSLWCGPYTVTDKIVSSNYWIQLIGSLKTLVFHKNRL